MRLSRLGIVAAPALAKSLQDDDPSSRGYCLWALSDIDYDPAVPAIAKCIGDPRPTKFHSSWGGPGGEEVQWRHSIGGFSCYVLASKALTSDTARIAFRKTFPSLAEREQEMLVKILHLEADHSQILREIDPGTSRSKRARSTA
jgi:hypothetical protein